LINDFGSIESIIKSSGKIANPGLRDKIESASAILRNNARLVSLKTEIPVREWKDIRTLKRSQPDWRLLENICEELELRSISKEINALIDSDYSEQPSAENKFTPDLFG
jgi:5'-3' exonuclease